MSLNLKAPEQYFTLDTHTQWLIRALDLIGAGLGLLLLSPLLLAIGLLIRLSSPGLALYRARRIGQGGRPFALLKFRTMIPNADRQGPGITTRHDPRITPLGRVLRRTKLDELPQLFNVIKGDMSLVGPRPEDPRYVTYYTAEQRQVLAVKPGMTSVASLHYHDEESRLHGDDWEKRYREEILPHKLTLELAYLQQRTLWRDIVLILRTLGTLLRLYKGLKQMLTIRNRHMLLFDVVGLLLTPLLAVSLRLDQLDLWSMIGPALLFYTAVSLAVKLLIFYGLGLYRRYWRYASVSDLLHVVIAVGAATFLLTGLFVAFFSDLSQAGLAMYRSVPLIDGLLTGLVVSASRFGLRGLNHLTVQSQALLGGRRVLVVGAGESGRQVVREMRGNPSLRMEPVAFVDDDPAKIGIHIQGLPVAGASHQIPGLVERYKIQRIVIALPSIPLGRQHELAALCRKTGVATHTLPGMYQILAGYKSISPIPTFDVHQLLRREPVQTDQQEVQARLSGAVVLVTGAGGSIGSELCRQIARAQPKAIILLGHGENSIFEIGLDLRLSFPNLTTYPAIVDVRDAVAIERVIDTYRPDVIYHAAAHKHVPFMESHVEEAITNNILGTQNVLNAAEKHGVPRFVLVSTDKAVNPTSIMGATKRMAELLVMAAARRSGQAYMAVRFGNVLGSRGSVLRVFQQQIAGGGPLTVTHPEMKRYFMTIPEAVQLVLQASVLGQGSEAFVLDMGQPVRIVDMARDLIKLAGLEPGRDIDVVFTGIRPGEKLDEELFLSAEAYRRTRHPKVFVATQEGAVQTEALEQVVKELISLTRRMRHRDTSEQIQSMLTQICYYIDKYQPAPAANLPAGPPSAPKPSPPSGPFYQSASTASL